MNEVRLSREAGLSHVDLRREDICLSEEVNVRIGTVSEMLLQNVIESQHLAHILSIIACDFKRKDKRARWGVTGIDTTGQPFTKRRKKIEQNSLTPCPMVFIMQNTERVRKAKRPAHLVKTGQAPRALPGNVNIIIRSAFLPTEDPADLPLKP